MLKKFRLEDSKPMKTPMSTETKLTRDKEGLWYPKGSDIEIIVYVDSDHAGDYVDRKSTSGVCTFMGCCLTSCFSKKKTVLAIFTIEVEYVSTGKACQQVLWMKQALVDYGVRLDDIPIMRDNKGAIDLSKNPVQHSRTKHIEIRHHFLHDNVQKDNISIEKVSSEDNIADILTKPLKREPFNYFRLELLMVLLNLLLLLLLSKDWLKNELKARGTLLMALPDKHQLKFNIYKDAKSLMEAIEKRFGGNKETKKVQKTLLKQQYENFTGSSSESLDQIHDRLQKIISQLKILVSDVPSIYAASIKVLASILPNVDNLSDAEMDLKWQMAMLTMRARIFLQRTGRNLEANGTTSIEFDMSKADEEPKNYALMAFTSSSSLGSDGENKNVFEEDIKLLKLDVMLRYNDLVELRKTFEKAKKEGDELKLKLENFQTSLKNLNESVHTSPVHDRYKSGERYHTVPPPYTRTFMPLKPDLVFHDASTVCETVPNVFNVEPSTTKPTKDLSQSNRPSAPIIKDENRILVTKPHNKIPYELLLGRTPSIGFMRPFGCLVTILNTVDPLGKFDGKANEGFLVGYYIRSGPTWLFDIDTLTQSMNYQLVVAENQPHSSVDPHNTDVDVAFDDKKNESEVNVSPRSSNKPKKHDEKLKEKLKERVITNGVNATSALVTVVGPNSTNSTNNFNVVGPSNNVVSPNFEIGGNFSFVDPSQYPDDPDMPALEDIVYSDDDVDVGAEADFSNLETSIRVSPIPTIRVHKYHLVTQFIGDLSLAPQTRSMTRMVKEQGRLTQINDEYFHTCMFACFLSQEEPKRVHQALKDPSWIEAIQEELL
nr:copia protein [Tanacetum cinerariifolium]